ncbi:uncharacterized protein MYCGRDRAFT_106657 [Zymoseptoria tritici IPO323]|uniref:Uncharacterized protein n=1 Tax=Zymoseptoria tritici (strain CBS 115943 / IPO323) TaxID=336722 RepID=F9XRP1_ZYMTI|nr:uncharacterized protein MYCGRDRAFT_106657 [Zymoseptoria tritici IPO323]EGP82069.1 hypothetical protein MYCGRDRAFT_106657 [Zymoseptoria tritici IPO323]
MFLLSRCIEPCRAPGRGCKSGVGQGSGEEGDCCGQAEMQDGCEQDEGIWRVENVKDRNACAYTVRKPFKESEMTQGLREKVRKLVGQRREDGRRDAARLRSESDGSRGRQRRGRTSGTRSQLSGQDAVDGA